MPFERVHVNPARMAPLRRLPTAVTKEDLGQSPLYPPAEKVGGGKTLVVWRASVEE